MKNFALVLFTTLSIFSFSSARSAQAGLFIGAISGNAAGGAAIGAGIGLVAITPLMIGLSSETGSGVGGVFAGLLLFGWMAAVPGAILDVDAALPTDQLTNELKKALPFIDSNEAVESLALMTKEKFKDQVSADPSTQRVMIQLSRQEVGSALQSTDLSDENFEQVVRLFE